MSYDVGTHIDLSHLNEVPAPAIDPLPQPEMIEEDSPSLYDIGTRFGFRLAGNRLITVRSIPVVFA